MKDDQTNNYRPTCSRCGSQVQCAQVSIVMELRGGPPKPDEVPIAHIRAVCHGRIDEFEINVSYDGSNIIGLPNKVFLYGSGRADPSAKYEQKLPEVERRPQRLILLKE